MFHPTFTDGFDSLQWPHNRRFYTTHEIRPQIRVHPIRGRIQGSDALSGWFRIVISLPILRGWTQFVKSFILFATDEQGNFIGTWERNPFNQDSQDCPPSHESKYMIIPCGGVSKYEAHVQKYQLENLIDNFEHETKHYEFFLLFSRLLMLSCLHVIIRRMEIFGQRNIKVINQTYLSSVCALKS